MRGSDDDENSLNEEFANMSFDRPEPDEKILSKRMITDSDFDMTNALGKKKLNTEVTEGLEDVGVMTKQDLSDRSKIFYL